MPSPKTLRLVDHQAEQHLSPLAREWLETQDLLTAAEVGALLRISIPKKVLQRWRAAGKLLALPIATGFVYPRFQFDAERGRIDPAAASTNARLRGSCWRQVEHWAAAHEAEGAG